MKIYVYAVVRENLDGSRGKRSKIIKRSSPDLRVGGLYAHLGKGYPGLQRVVAEDVYEISDAPNMASGTTGGA